MRVFLPVSLVLTLVFAACKQQTTTTDTPNQQELKEKTAFQTSTAYMPEIDVQSDIAIVYGAQDDSTMTFKERLKTWRDHGYTTHFMTGMAWGDYKDFFLGNFDGTNHLEDVAQREVDFTPILHNVNSPYVVPVAPFVNFLKNGVVKKAIDEGITSIYLEEPEFWARAGYSDAFKEEWKNYYGTEWEPQDASPQATYLSNKLKYYLFYEAIKEVSTFAKTYGASKGLDINVYIPTHSLINYSAWQIVSPEASLASLPSIDGYIAQVWTGTSRTPNFYKGVRKERVFENAFLEYNSVISMTAPTGRKVFLLTDPIEDQVRDWADYKRNYEATFTAELLFPDVADFEVMPWPERIYTRPFKVTSEAEEMLISKDYATQMQVMINSLNEVPVSENKVSGSHGIGVLMANSLMFQRFPVHKSYTDSLFSNFYGQTMPLIKRGIPVETVHIENLKYEESLKEIKVLVMSYANMKPLEEESHGYLADWVKNGGILIYCGENNDPYQRVKEWWNSDGNDYAFPAAHLFEKLNIKQGAQTRYEVGKGSVYILNQNPKAFVMETNGEAAYLDIVREAYRIAQGEALQEKNSFILERGNYIVAAVMDESITAEPLVIEGPVIDLYDPQLSILNEKNIKPGEQAYLYNLKRLKTTESKILASAARIYDEKKTASGFQFTAKSPANTVNAMQVYLPFEPKSAVIRSKNKEENLEIESNYNKTTQTLFLSFDNEPEGVEVLISAAP